jgi:hypothetical protein
LGSGKSFHHRSHQREGVFIQEYLRVEIAIVHYEPKLVRSSGRRRLVRDEEDRGRVG